MTNSLVQTRGGDDDDDNDDDGNDDDGKGDLLPLCCAGHSCSHFAASWHRQDDTFNACNKMIMKMKMMMMAKMMTIKID